MSILLIFPGFIVAFIIVIYYERKMKNVINEAYKNKNKVRFYVARDKDGKLWLYMSKPLRYDDQFLNDLEMYHQVLDNYSCKSFGLKEKDYANLKWEDEPVEVFINIED